MFLVSLCSALYGFVCVLTILLVLIQRGKSSLGLGNIGGGNQALFGSSGGQDIFQKITWTFLAIILAGSLFLAIVKNKNKFHSSSYFAKQIAQELPVDNQAE